MAKSRSAGCWRISKSGRPTSAVRAFVSRWSSACSRSNPCCGARSSAVPPPLRPGSGTCPRRWMTSRRAACIRMCGAKRAVMWTRAPSHSPRRASRCARWNGMAIRERSVCGCSPCMATPSTGRWAATSVRPRPGWRATSCAPMSCISPSSAWIAPACTRPELPLPGQTGSHSSTASSSRAMSA